MVFEKVNIQQMLDHFKQVPVVRFAVLEFYQGYLFDKREMLNEEFKKLKKSGVR